MGGKGDEKGDGWGRERRKKGRLKVGKGEGDEKGGGWGREKEEGGLKGG